MARLRPIDEIDVTLAMIKAGANEVASYDPEYDRPEEAAEEIYRLMEVPACAPVFPGRRQGMAAVREFGDRT